MFTRTIAPLEISPHILSLPARARNDADRLWAEHTFNEPDLLIIPAYMLSRPRTAYHTRIQMELMRNWQLDIARSITSVEEFLDTPEYEYMKERANMLGKKVGEWRKAVERMESGGKMKVKKEVGMSEGAKIKAPQVNYGFSKSTVVIPFKRGAEEEPENDETLAKKIRTEAGEEEEEKAVAEKIVTKASSGESVHFGEDMMVVSAEKVRADSADVAKEMEKEKEVGVVEKPGDE